MVPFLESWKKWIRGLPCCLDSRFLLAYFFFLLVFFPANRWPASYISYYLLLPLFMKIWKLKFLSKSHVYLLVVGWYRCKVEILKKSGWILAICGGVGDWWWGEVRPKPSLFSLGPRVSSWNSPQTTQGSVS